MGRKPHLDCRYWNIADLQHGKIGHLHRNLQFSIQDEGNIYLVEGLETPFVMGLIHPADISSLRTFRPGKALYPSPRANPHPAKGPCCQGCWILLVCLHWFNPLVWVAFFLSSKDMEMSCDESVIKKLGSEAKRGYSATLLALATGRTIVGGSPLAFGEGTPRGGLRMCWVTGSRPSGPLWWR